MSTQLADVLGKAVRMKRRGGLLLTLLVSQIGFTASSFAQSPNVYTLRPNEDRTGFLVDRYQYVSSEPVHIGSLTASSQRVNQGDWPTYWAARPNAISYLRSQGFLYDPSVEVDPSNTPPKPAPVLRATPTQKETARAPDKAKQKTNNFPIFGWIWKNIAVILAILSLPILSFFARNIWNKIAKQRATKKIEMIYCGLPAAGKTALIARLRHPDLPPAHFDDDATTRKMEEKAHDPIVKSGLTFVPTAIDIPGSKPAWLLERLMAPRRNYSRRVLLIVLAPFAEIGARAKVDDTFVAKQSGYMFGLVGAVLESKSVPKPNLAVLFLNKRDVFDGLDAEFNNAFKTDVARIEMLCKERGIPVLKFHGSARTGAGVQGMLGSIVERLGG